MTPNYGWAFSEFGGANYTNDYLFYNNIIFTNGDLDPWSVGGITKYVNPDLAVFNIRGGAHHLDLRSANEADPHDVKWVRLQAIDLIKQWNAVYSGNTKSLSEITWSYNEVLQQ